ncbi:MAG: hypothetical protein LAP61_03910 [Acidobacteriia bacterium]|jgi:hypothetical protein|nr:hypothetical protein [Terriglobia bacterium]
MKPVGTTLLVVCLASLVVGAVVLAAPEISPGWSVGALALVTAVLLVVCAPRGAKSGKAPARGRVIFEKRIRFSPSGLPEEPRRSGGQHEILLRIVDARGSYIRNAGSRPQPLSRKGSRTL